MRARRQTEDQAALYNTVFVDSPVGISVSTPDGRMLAVNRALCGLLGYSSAELLDISLDDIVHPDDLPNSRDGLRALLSGTHTSWVSERRSLRKGGETVWTRVTTVLERDADGAPLTLHTYFEDIDEQLQIKEVLSKRAKELACLFEFSRLVERPGIEEDAVLQGAAELLPSAFLYADIAGARISMDGAEFVSSGFVASRWRVSAPLELLNEPTGSVEICYRQERPEADNGPFLTEEVELLKTMAQRLGHVIDRRRVARRLRVSEERFALAARGANDGIWDWDLVTDEMMLSPRWKSMLGYDEDELADSVATWLDLLHPDDKDAFWESISSHLSGDAEIYEGESRLRHKDGRYVPVLTRGFALRRESDGAAQRFVGTNTDLTELTAVEVSLHEAISELRSSNQELEQFAYAASHDLQEPLRMVASYTQLLARRYGDKLDQDAQDFIGYAVDGATRMQQLIQDLLVYSRVTTRSAPPAPFALQWALDEALANLGAAIAESGAAITADDLPTILGDRSQVAQLLQNLIGNSIKFRRSEASPQIHLSAQPDPDDNGLWLFQVADNGIGIDPKYADRVFVIFQRLHGGQEYPGTGIGLALCKRIAERHGGSIWLQPDRADGTTVNFTLPKADSMSNEEGDTDERND